MYHAHFGLQKGLFGDGIASDAAVFRAPQHDAVGANFKLALGNPSSGVVLRGPAGVGKSTLTAAVLRASSTRLALAWINATPTNAAELLELVLVELGVNTVGTTRIERLQLWRQFQAETRATESRLFVVVERTEDLPTEVLHALDSLTAADVVGNLGANFVLLGHGAIEEHLAAPVLESLRQRIRLRAELVPFTQAELQDYLRHQVACAGGHFDHVFAPGAVAALHRHSAGVARLANNLCETALDVAAAQQQKLLTPELVTKTAQSVLGLVESVPAARTVLPRIVMREPAPVAVAFAAPVVAGAALAAPVVAAPPPAIHPAVVQPALAAAPLAPIVPVIAAAAAAPVSVAAAAPVVTAAPVAVALPAVASPVAPSSAVAATQAPIASTAPVIVASRKLEPEFEFDGGATDISDVAMADFPVLTDAVEDSFVAPPKRVAALPPSEPIGAAPSAPASPPVVATRASAAPPAAKPAAPPASRLETAYAAPKSAAKPAPIVAPPVAPAAKAAPPSLQKPIPAVDSDDDDLLRQTQTMRAISAAKSIDDISSSMAETLFGDAELDLVTAALASAAADWPDDEDEDEHEPVKAAAPPAPSKAEPQKKVAEPVEDPFDFLGLGSDAPLELMDDSTLPPANRAPRSAAR